MFIFLGGHSWVDDLYTATKIIAVVAAAIFFFYKALTGYLVTNMSIELSLSRRRADDNYDYLAVVVTLTKGDRGTVRIQDAKARITEGATPLPPHSASWSESPYACSAGTSERLVHGQLKESFSESLSRRESPIRYIRENLQGRGVCRRSRDPR